MDIFDQITDKKTDIFDQIAGGSDIFDDIAPGEQVGLTKPAPALAKDMMSQMVGLDRPQSIPLKETHPTLWAAGKTAMDMPGLIERAAMSVVSGATWSLPERAEEAGEWLSRKLFGEGRKGGATGTWKEEPQLKPYVEKGLRFGGQMINIHFLGKSVAAPIINTVMKHKHLAPLARMIGWGVAGATHTAGERMLSEGELPTPQELLKSGGIWATIEGVMSSAGWTGRLAIGLNRLSKTWTIPKKEVLKIVMREAKKRGMPFAKYIYAKAGVQKALSLKEKASAKEFLNMVDGLIVPFKKRGTYADLVKQLEKESVEGRIKSLEAYARKSVKTVTPVPKPKPTQRIDMLEMGKTRGKILTEDLPDWVRKVEGDIRYGTPVSNVLRKKYHDFFLARQKPSWESKLTYYSGGSNLESKTGIYFTPDKKLAESFAKGRGAFREAELGKFDPRKKSTKLIETTLDIKNPKKVAKEGFEIPETSNLTKEKIAGLKKQGYDSMILYEGGKIGEVVVFDKSQIKSLVIKPQRLKSKPSPEAIKAKGAALKFPDGTIIAGQTHAVAYQKALNKGLEKQLDKGFEEGFVTISNKFITRDQAQVLYKASETNALLKKGVIETGKPVLDIVKFAKKYVDKQGNWKMQGDTLRKHLSKRNNDELITLIQWAEKQSPHVKRNVKSNTADILRGRGFPVDEIKWQQKNIRPTTKSGTTLGFGPTGELQNMYEKLMAGRLHKPLKKKIADGIPRKLSADAQLVMDALKKVKPLSAKQKEIYSIERGKRLTEAIALRGITSGERGYHTELKALEGSMEHLELEPIRKLITQKTVNNLMNEIRDCPILSNWETYPARKALAQILQGSMPTEGGQTLLRDVFGKRFANELLKKRALWLRVKDAGIMAVNFTKAIKSSFDVSAPLRQGVFLIRRYKQWLPAFRDMFKYFGSKEAYHEGTLSIRRHHNYKLAKEHKLALTDLGSITSREEAFQSPWAEKIPGVGASARAYTGFLNQLRFDVFNDFVKKGQRLGLLKNEKYLRTAAKYINHATGRGHLMGLEGVATELNTVFFSPRLIMSRLQLINPVFYIRLEKNVRKEALKDLFAFAGLATMVGGLAKMAGLGVETDMRSADFMKLKVGNRRYDILGGFQQPIRATAQFISGEIVSSTTGKTLTLGEGYKPMTRLGIAGRFLQYKLSPVASFTVTLLTGQSTMGGKVDIPTEIGRLFVPMAAQDIYEVYDDEGLGAMPLASPAFLGVGLQTYGGVSTYGLSGKDYKTLNAELSRLKTSLGFPSTSVYGQELTNKEYKAFKNKAGKEIARSVENVMKASFYKKANDDGKRHIVDQVIDHTKEKVKRELFKKYMFIQQRAAAIRKATYKPVQESRKMAKEQVDKLRRK